MTVPAQPVATAQARPANRGSARAMRARALVGDRAITLWFVAFSFALAFWQRPGWATADTKIDLHVDPGQFLSQVASAWTSTGDLGEVHSAQYSGYLWPMGPFFAAVHAIGISDWVAERLWLGLLFALSAWGMLKLLDVLVGRPRGAVHVVAGAFYLLNPYVVVFTARTSITLLGYAALPWLLLITFHGIKATRARRSWRSWWWAAGFALILTSTGGGVNAAVVGWMLFGPLVLAIYEPAIGNARWRDSAAFLVRVGILGLLASAWWIVPVLVHVRFGIDFLQFTEQPATIWGTNSLTESLRLMGYWTSYIGVGFGVSRPFFSDGATLLFNPLVVGASLLIPALAVAGFVRARRLSYAPFLLALVVVGVVIETAGFPDGTPVRGTMVWIYEHIFVLSFMRTTNKAAPLVAVGVAGLLGLGVRAALAWLRQRPTARLRRGGPVAVAVAVTALIVLAALPLVRGGAIDTQLSFKRIPAGWTQAATGLDRSLPANTRAIVLPGQIFAYYNWGGSLDAILPRLTTRPVAVRYETPYSDLHADDLLITVDDLVQQDRLVPGELTPLLRLMGVGAVITGADDDISRSGALDPNAAAGVLAGQGLRTPNAAYGVVKPHPAAAGDIGPTVELPEVRRYDVAGARGIVHLDPAAAPTVVDGSAQSLAEMAAFGTLPAAAPIFYAGDQSEAQLRSLAAQGANLVVGDSNRRQEFLPESTQQNLGVTLPSDQSIPVNAADLDPFASAAGAAQTVAALRGARYLDAPSEPGELQFPEAAPIAAFDGNLQTAWAADRNLPVFDRWIQIGFDAPRAVPYVRVYPLDDSHGAVTEVDVNGIDHAVGPGWTTIPLHLRSVSALRLTITGLRQPRTGEASAGGFREVRIPGFHVTEYLRAPVVIGRDLAGVDLAHDSLSYLLARTTGDEPFDRNVGGVDTLLDDPSDRGDAEAQIQRIVFAPVTRAYAASAWVYPAVGTPDSTLDRLAGYRGPDVFDSSGRFQDQPAYRASSAFAAGSRVGWIGVWRPGAPAPWISWSTPRALTVSRLTIAPSAMVVRRATRVALSFSGGATGPLVVGPGGTVTLPRPVTARAFRLTILSAAFPAGATAQQRQALAVGIGALSVPGIPAVSIPIAGALHAPCGTVAIAVDGRSVAMAPVGTVAQLDAGRPLPARACAPVSMAAGVAQISSLPGPFSVDLLRLASAAPSPLAPATAATAAAGRLLDPGRIGNSTVSGVRVTLSAPTWLVLGESYDAGWQASCNGRSLGAPRVIDGYANGWLAPAGCTSVTFTFGPQAGINRSYALSAVACAVMLLLLVIGAWRAPAAATVPRDALRRLPPWTGGPVSLPRAALLALIASIPLGYLFAIRAGLGLFALLTFVLWRGYRPRTLALAAAAMLGIAVPVAYLIGSPHNQGGYGFAYSTQTIGAHWIGVAAIVLLSLVLWRLIRARAR
ncbi:MAG: alpha-(1-_3)-arabinofuranosyltransferase family protein [Solirubrobacteraceae bacterium]